MKNEIKRNKKIRTAKAYGTITPLESNNNKLESTLKSKFQFSKQK